MRNLLAALADETRLQIIDQLARSGQTAGELAARFPIARPGVSRHLRVLREAGLVEVRTVGRQRVYQLAPEPLSRVDAWLERYRGLWTQRLDALETEVARGNRARRDAAEDAGKEQGDG